jgi:hypothetical protein
VQTEDEKEPTWRNSGDIMQAEEDPVWIPGEGASSVCWEWWERGSQGL